MQTMLSCAKPAPERCSGPLLAAVVLATVLCIHVLPALGNGASSPLPSSTDFHPERYHGKRLVLFLYATDAVRVDEAVKTMIGLHAIRRDYNFEIVGICLTADNATGVQRFNTEQGITFPVFIDHGRHLAAKLGMVGSLAMYVYSDTGRLLTRSLAYYAPAKKSLSHVWQSYAAKYLDVFHVPEDRPVLGYRPPVPAFQGTTLSGDVIDIRTTAAAKPVIITLFSPRCHNCRNELKFLESLYTSNELRGRFEVVAVSRMGRRETQRFWKEKKYSFPVMIDSEQNISSLFPSFIGLVPVSYVVDRAGRIDSVHTGYSVLLNDIYIMELKKLAGLPNPPLLERQGYSGEQRCGICHEKEHVQWRLTRHADAFLSLERKGRTHDKACIACHVTGYDQKGGYTFTKGSDHLKGVQCEACHGPGYQACSAFTGAAPDDTTRKATNWKPLCLRCHTDKESLNFVYARRFPRIVHSNVPDLSSMDHSERTAFMRAALQKQQLFDNPAAYVGAEACRECHRKQYDHWRTTAHADAFKQHASASPDKQYRFTTGMGAPGGYPEPGREGVQCEACHGPGEKHVADPEAKGHNFIVGLGSECSSCVVEQICRRCHSLEDDPNFEFDRQIEKVRHPRGNAPAQATTTGDHR